jgi:hypothetical protein
MHCHQSLWKDGSPLFYDEVGYAGLSDTARYYIGGLLKHAPSLLAFTNPTVNSYHRLVPGYEAPVNLVYSQRNRSACVRIPITGSNPKAKRIEFRVPDPSCNPYFAFAAMLMAGIDGIRNKIEPPEPVDKDLYELPPDELAAVPQVPGSLDAVLDALDATGFSLTLGVHSRIDETVRRIVARIDGRPYAVVNPGGRLDERRVGPEVFSAASRALAEAGIASIVTWGPGEQEIAHRCAEGAPGACVAPPTSIDQLAALMRGARLTVCNNTGPMHLSVAVGTPTLAFFVRMEVARWGHMHAPHRMIDVTSVEDPAAEAAQAARAFAAGLSGQAA